MRIYLFKEKNNVFYVVEGYNEGNQKIISGFDNAVRGISSGRKLIRSMDEYFNCPIYGVKWIDGCVIYAVCEKNNVDKLEDYVIVHTIGELIAKGGGLWSNITTI